MPSIVLFAIDSDFQQCGTDTKTRKITMLSGKQTGRLSVGTAIGPFGQQLEVTTIERTLIDATVRPAYSGGIEAVLRAFKIARPRVSIATLMALLTKLDYAYPYHQAIGFYLKKADYSQSDQLLAKANGLRFNFYLSHGLQEPEFDEEWKIYFPRSLKYHNDVAHD